MSKRQTSQLFELRDEFLLAEYDKTKKEAQEIQQLAADDPMNNPIEQLNRRYNLRLVRGLVLARMGGLTPPFQFGERVESVRLTTPYRSEGEQPTIQKGGRYRVYDMTYSPEPDVGWLISVHNLSEFALFKASDFRKFMPSEATAEEKTSV